MNNNVRAIVGVVCRYLSWLLYNMMYVLPRSTLYFTINKYPTVTPYLLYMFLVYVAGTPTCNATELKIMLINKNNGYIVI